MTSPWTDEQILEDYRAMEAEEQPVKVTIISIRDYSLEHHFKRAFCMAMGATLGAALAVSLAVTFVHMAKALLGWSMP